ncbi:hypothetical protein GW17_00001518 [Ensete ventricosum]|nr:hypothetical protein GW17_00001518 [Ensete ventricosum]
MEIPERGDCEGRCQGSGGGRAGRQAGALLEAPEPGLPAAGGRRGLVVDAWLRGSTATILIGISHVDNLMIGVTKGYRYDMRFYH